MPAVPRAFSLGFTLVECLVGLGVLAVLVGAAAPRLDDLIQARRLVALSGLLEADLQHARALAVARHATLRFEITPPEAGGPACYLLHTGRKGDCRCGHEGATTCQPGAALLRSAALGPELRVSLRASAPSFVFEPVIGAVTPATTIEFTDAGGRGMRLVVNAMGRVRRCAQGVSLQGWPPC